MKKTPARTTAFSLVEVVLAIGIVSFSLLVVIGLFGGMLRSAGENVERRSMSEAIDSLRAHLTETVGFTNTFDMAKSKDALIYVTYRAAPDGSPDPSSRVVMGFWTNAGASGLGTYDDARVGRWLAARLEFSASNPSGTNLATIDALSNRASLSILANIQPIATPNQTATNSGALQATMAIMR